MTTPAAISAWLRQPGHRFFFSRRRSSCSGSSRPAPAGGIIAGAEYPGGRHRQHLLGRRRVWRRSGAAAGAAHAGPTAVRVVDFGIRGFDLACALVDGADVTILVDACPRGRRPARSTVIEPDLAALDAPATEPPGARSARPGSAQRSAPGDTLDGAPETRSCWSAVSLQSLGGDEGHDRPERAGRVSVDDAVQMISR